MRATRNRTVTSLMVAACVVASALPALAAKRAFTLTNAVPDDVFIVAAAKHTSASAFLTEYWSEIWEEAKGTGVGDDLWDLIGSFLNEEQMDEARRLRDRATELLSGVDWAKLQTAEIAFGERFVNRSGSLSMGAIMGPPEWVVLLRTDDAEKTYEGLVGLVEGTLDEIQNAAGAPGRFSLDKTPRHGVPTAMLNPLAGVSGAPDLTFALSRRGDVIVIVMGERMLDDVLHLLANEGDVKPITETARFKAALAKLPPATDAMTFFDMQAMLERFRGLADAVASAAGKPGDVYLNDRIDDEANKINGRAVAAYSNGDMKEALALTEQAHKMAPTDSVILYNLACFSTLNGDPKAGLRWLDRAVDAGFHAPGKIAEDADLTSLRGEKRFQETLARAARLASESAAEDVVLNSTKSGEAYELCQQAWKVYEDEEYAAGLKLIEQAYEKAPEDSRVLYYLACFHALAENEDKALDFLQKSVDAGFHSPNHIASDPDLKLIRPTERYRKALADARTHAAAAGARDKADWSGMVQSLSSRILDSVGILDYTAEVQTTDGHSVRKHSVVSLVPDARTRAIYPVIAQGRAADDFDRFLPAETESFSVGSGINVAALYAFLLDTVRGVGPQGEALLAKWDAIQKQMEIDVRRDVLGWIGGSTASVTFADAGGSVWLLEVTDAELAGKNVDRAIGAISALITQAATQNPMIGMMAIRQMPSQDERLPGFGQIFFGMSPQPVIWGVAEGHLIFSDSADAVVACLDTARGKHPGIRTNERVMSESLPPKGKFTGASLDDQRALGQEIAMGMGMVSMLGGMVTMAIPDPTVQKIISKVSGMLGKLTPVAAKIDFFKSTAMRTTFDGGAWHIEKVTHYVSPSERAERRVADKG